MKRLSSLLHHAARALAVAATTVAAAGCSEMHTDVPECQVNLRFKYDYNTDRADMFADQVGGLTLYVFDKDNRFLFKKDTANTASFAPLKDRPFTWVLTHRELGEGEYRIVALANQKSYDETLQTSGAKYRRTTLTKGDDISALTTTLDRNAAGYVAHQNMPLDTLWATREVKTLKVEYGSHKTDTLALMRDTKQLNITLRQTAQPDSMDYADYDVKIIDNNGRLLYNNDVDPTDTQLTYTPYAQWNTEMAGGTASSETRQATLAHSEQQSGGDAARVGASGNASSPEKKSGGDAARVGASGNASSKASASESTSASTLRTAHYELFFNRLKWHDNNQEDARLVVTHKPSGKVILNANLPALLKDGRGAYELYHWGVQEYLDREQRYHLDLFLSGTEWKYIDVVVEVLSWAHRVQNVVL